jgi:hypothetical protein
MMSCTLAMSSFAPRMKIAFSPPVDEVISTRLAGSVLVATPGANQNGALSRAFAKAADSA